MSDAGDPQALGQLLRSRRERLAPADVGLVAGSRRRTAGLRREEVAQLSNVSTTYYTFLEQGRPVRPSAQVLDSLAAALLMNESERRYLLVLAGREPLATPPALAETVVPGIRDLVDRLEPSPVILKGRRWDVLACNESARALFTDWDSAAADDRNLVRWMFTSDRAREVYVKWEFEAQAMLGRFRLAAARHPGDPSFEELIAQLHLDSPLVRDWWPRHDISPIASGTKWLRNQQHGPLEYQHVVLQVADEPDQTFVIYTPTGLS